MEKLIRCNMICEKTGEIRQKTFSDEPHIKGIASYLYRKAKKIQGGKVKFEVEYGFYEDAYLVEIDEKILSAAGIGKAIETRGCTEKYAIFDSAALAAKFIETLLAA